MTVRSEPDFDKQKMIYFNPDHDYIVVSDMARGMTKNEVCDYFGCTYTELQDEDKKFFDFFWRQGKAQGKHIAVTKLFESMNSSSKGSGQTALSYLIRFGDSWDKEESGDSEIKEGKKSFRVVLD